MANQAQLKFVSEDNAPPDIGIRAHHLSSFFHSERISVLKHYVPHYNKKIVFFNFNSVAHKEKALNSSELAATLTRLKFKPIDLSPGYSNVSHRKVYINALCPNHFDLYQDGDTIESKQNQLVHKIKATPEGAAIVDHHFIRSPVDPVNDPYGAKKAPSSMTATFRDFKAAEDFIAVDSNIEHGIIVARNKRFHKEVPLVICNQCWRTGHRRGSTECDKIAVCRKCRSTDHTAPLVSCDAKCSIHGLGHTDTSAVCE
ncbi:unnamed protein product, partial [Meganyctiphanes norvegica]